MRLFLYECKKILFSRVNILVLIAFLLISLWSFNVNTKDNQSNALQQSYYNNGQLMSMQEVKKEVAHEKQQWSGTMDDSWWQELEEAFVKYNLRLNERIYDVEKMNELYGTGWNLDFIEHPNDYTTADNSELNQDKKQLIMRSTFLPANKEEIAGSVVFDIYMNYAEILLENKPWNNENGTYGTMYSGFDNEVVPVPVYSYNNLSHSEILLLKQTMNEVDSFTYGDSKEWMSLLETLGTAGQLLMIWVLLISTDVVNMERKSGMMEIQNTCVHGKSRLILSKLGAVFTCGIIGFLSIVRGISLYALLVGGIGDAAVNITENLHMISIFTYGQGYLIGVAILFLGVLASAMIGCFVSTMVKSPYLSLTLSIGGMVIVPTLLSIVGRFTVLFPFGFMSIIDVSVRNFTILLFDKVYFLWRLLPLIWIPIIIILILITWRKYIARSYQVI